MFFPEDVNFSHISKMKITTNINMIYMNSKYYLKEPMQMVERRLNMIIAKNPQLTNSLNRGSDHPLITKYLHIPFNN